MARQKQDLTTAAAADLDRRQRRVPAPLPPPMQAATQSDLLLVATRLATVEDQLTSYFSSIAAQANATRLAAESARHEARADLEQLAVTVRDAIDRLTTQSAEDRRSLRLALDARLADVGSQQEWRFAELEARVEAVAERAASLPLDGLALAASGSMPVGLEAKVDGIGTELTRVLAEIARLDANGAALHHHVGELREATQRGAAEQVESRLAELRAHVDQSIAMARSDVSTMRTDIGAELTVLRAEAAGVEAGLRTELTNHVTGLLNERIAAIGTRVDEHIGGVSAEVAALRQGIDQTLSAVSARLGEMEEAQDADRLRLSLVEELASKVDHKEIEHLREKMQSAVGEAVLMRIEMDRLSGSLDERFDSMRVRLSEVEAQVADNMDVSAAVQLERLEELERAVMFIAPGSVTARAAVPAAAPTPAVVPLSTVPPPPLNGAPTTSSIVPPPPPPAFTTTIVPPAPAPSGTVPPPPPAPLAGAVRTPPLAAASAVPPPPGASTTPPPPPPGAPQPAGSTHAAPGLIAPVLVGTM